MHLNLICTHLGLWQLGHQGLEIEVWGLWEWGEVEGGLDLWGEVGGGGSHLGMAWGADGGSLNCLGGPDNDCIFL